MKLFLKIFAFLLVLAIGTGLPIAQETVYFLVGEMSIIPAENRKNDSYVLPLSRADDIDHARYLISRNLAGSVGTAPFVGARVAPGKDDINRNYLDPRLPEWSWHVVSQSIQFYEVTGGNFGGPTSLENDPDWYLGNDGRQGGIGFSLYTVVRELGPVPLYLSVIPEGQKLQFYWSGAGTNYVYTLEGKDSLASMDWLALPGAWPLKTNHWTLTLANAPTHFYRVRAESSAP